MTNFDYMAKLMIGRDLAKPPMPTLRGMPVDACEYVPEFQSRWVFPERRFVQFEKSDEGWARRLGFGYEVKERLVYKIGSTLMMHPKTLEALLASPDMQNDRPQV